MKFQENGEFSNGTVLVREVSMDDDRRLKDFTLCLRMSLNYLRGEFRCQGLLQSSLVHDRFIPEVIFLNSLSLLLRGCKYFFESHQWRGWKSRP